MSSLPSPQLTLTYMTSLTDPTYFARALTYFSENYEPQFELITLRLFTSPYKTKHSILARGNLRAMTCFNEKDVLRTPTWTIRITTKLDTALTSTTDPNLI